MSTREKLQPPSYPLTKAVNVRDTYHGTEVPDPYRWLEDDQDPEVGEWTEKQQRTAHKFLRSLPGRGAYSKRLEEVWKYTSVDQPVLRGERLFFEKKDGVQPQAVLYVRENGTDRVLLDPNELSPDGSIALMEWETSANGELLAYALSENGEDWRTVMIRSVESGEPFDEQLTKVKFSNLSWMPDGSGFFYGRFPDDATDAGENNREQIHQVYFHVPGTPQADDLLIYQHPTLTGVILVPEVTADGRYLTVTTAGESYIYNRLYAARLADWDPQAGSQRPLEFLPMYDELDASYECVGTLGEELVLLTSRDAPRQRIAAAHPGRPEQLRTIVPESDEVISHAVIAGGQLIVTSMVDAHDVVRRYSLEGELIGEIGLPGIGSTFGAAARALPEHNRVFIPFSSFLYPPTILEFDLTSGETTVFFSPEVTGFNADEYETRQVFATSADGTQVPLFVTCKHETTLDGSNPTILFGYGGFDVSLKPWYINFLPVWLEEGGVFVVANLRGGGEYGDEWHRGGMFEKKQNVFDDFAAAATALITEGYCTSRHLAIEGGSNGGLLVAATMLQHPELFGAVLCHVPVADMLRFQHFTAGRYWTSEFGDAERSKQEFETLYSYSPVHNVSERAAYPPILIMSADHDDRVVPMHSKKLAARMQAANPDNIVLLRIETKAGHGAGKPLAKQVEQRADVFAFLAATIR